MRTGNRLAERAQDSVPPTAETTVQFYESMIELVGNTPLVRLNNVTRGIQATVLVKVEYFNPGGSVKDRIAVRMIEAAEQSGELQPGGTIVEPTSGNTGVGLAIVAQQKGYKCIFVCPDKVSTDKINVLRAYGAEVVVCPTAVDPEHPDSYYNVSDRLVRETPGAWKPDQYSNPNNPRSHYETTGPELWEQTDGRITHFVAGVGTGGTISGTGRYLKDASEGRVQVIGADPEGSVYSGGSGRPYLIEGVGEDFWPSAYDRTVADEIVAVSDKDAFQMTRRLAKEEGLLVGGSCGMAVVAGLEVASRLGPGRCRGRAAAGQRPRLSLEDLQRRVDGGLRLPGGERHRGPRRRGAQAQGGRPALAGAHAPGGDRRRGDRRTARVRRLADADRQAGRRAPRCDGRRGRRLGRRAGTARRAVHQERVPRPTRWRSTCARRCRRSARASRSPT